MDFHDISRLLNPFKKADYSRDASAATRRDVMTATTIVRLEPTGPAGKGLERWPDMPAAELASGTPVQHGCYYLNDAAHGLSVGVWDCTAFTSKPMSYPVNEFMILLEGAVTILEKNGRETTVRAGESFVLPKGLDCTWRQTGHVRKFFVIFDDASGTAPRDAAALAVPTSRSQGHPVAFAGAGGGHASVSRSLPAGPSMLRGCDRPVVRGSLGEHALSPQDDSLPAP
jgi:uncharacterized cupin superfamily protein